MTASLSPAHAPLDPDRPIRRVAILFALSAEGLGLAQRLGLSDQGQLDPPLPAHWWQGRHGGASGAEGFEVAIGFAGPDPELAVDRIGTMAAVLAGYKLQRTFKPDLLINAGTAGGFKARGGEVGSVQVADGAILFHDHRVPLPGWDAFGEGRIPAGVTDEVAAVLGATRGVVSTGDSFAPCAEELAFFDREAVHVKEMEAAGLARLARDLGLPFLAVKAITDLVDDPEPEQDAFVRNLSMVSARLQDRLADLLDWLAAGRRVRDVLPVG
jgi:5'-methylthioadenosine nucleosidase